MALKKRKGEKKKAASGAKKSRPAAPKPRAAASPAPADKARRDAWLARHKKYTELFGPAFPKGKVLAPDGNYVTAAAATKQDLCFAQYPPRPDRIGWLYVTHGLSQACVKGDRPARTELAVHWRDRDTKALGILAEAAQSLLVDGHPMTPGAILSCQERPKLSVVNLQHWIICLPDQAVPAHLDVALGGKKAKGEAGRIRFILLMGISDAELQCALKVNPSLADGRQVLLEALQTGGVFPMSDPSRTCLTRRGDFHRLWEHAFHAVRERAANGSS
jgi:hypothetical protein